jgi:hypothetical protein
MFAFILTAMVVIPKSFSKMKDDIADWEEDPELRKVSVTGLLSVGGIAVISLVLGVFTGRLQSAIWVPTMLYPLSTETAIATGGLFSLLMDLFITVFSVVPGEESLTESFTPLFKAYEQFDWASDIPYCFQPAVLTGRAVWASWHVVKGQYPLFFFVTVLCAGIVLDFLTARSGTTLTKWIGHAGWNIFVIFSTFISEGYLSVTVG